jgi:hypothetical protein
MLDSLCELDRLGVLERLCERGRLELELRFLREEDDDALLRDDVALLLEEEELLELLTDAD